MSATTDDRPFFFQLLRWRDIPGATDFGGAHTTALQYVVLATLLATLTLLGLVFILGPLVWLERHRPGSRHPIVWGLLAYFAALGAGFMAIEVTLIQRFTLILGHPSRAFALVLGLLLPAMGMGSLLSDRVVTSRHRLLTGATILLMAELVLLEAGLSHLEAWALGVGATTRYAVAATIVCPLGLTLGVFLPVGVRIAAQHDSRLVPWVWAVNGCSSVTAGVGAVVLAMGVGFGAVWWAAGLVYAAGALALWITGRGVDVRI